MSEQEKEEKTGQDDERLSEDDTVICGTCGQVVGKSWIGTHRFLTHSIERRNAGKDREKSPKKPEKRSERTADDGGGEDKGESKKRRTSVYFGDR